MPQGGSYQQKIDRGMREVKKALRTHSTECGGPDYETANFYLEFAAEAARDGGLQLPENYNSLRERVEKLREQDERRDDRKTATEEVKSERFNDGVHFDPFITDVCGYPLIKPKGDVGAFFSLFDFPDRAQKKVEDF